MDIKPDKPDSPDPLPDKPDPLPDLLALPPLPVLTSERIMLREPRDADIDDRLRHPIDQCSGSETAPLARASPEVQTARAGACDAHVPRRRR